MTNVTEDDRPARLGTCPPWCRKQDGEVDHYSTESRLPGDPWAVDEKPDEVVVSLTRYDGESFVDAGPRVLLGIEGCAGRLGKHVTLPLADAEELCRRITALVSRANGTDDFAEVLRRLPLLTPEEMVGLERFLDGLLADRGKAGA